MVPRISRTARVSTEAIISKLSEVHDNAELAGPVRLENQCWVTEDALLEGAISLRDVRVSGLATIKGHVTIHGCEDPAGVGTHIYADARVRAPDFVHLIICGPIQFGDHCEVLSARHYLCVGPLGSEDRFATAYRTVGGGHYVIAGCWEGTLDELESRIQPGGEHNWLAYEEAQCRSDYQHFIDMARARADEWLRES